MSARVFAELEVDKRCCVRPVLVGSVLMVGFPDDGAAVEDAAETDA